MFAIRWNSYTENEDNYLYMNEGRLVWGGTAEQAKQYETIGELLNSFASLGLSNVGHLPTKNIGGKVEIVRLKPKPARVEYDAEVVV